MYIFSAVFVVRVSGARFVCRHRYGVGFGHDPILPADVNRATTRTAAAAAAALYRSLGRPAGRSLGREQARMERESSDTIVGINAPVDLAGRTPLAWSVKANKKKRNREVCMYMVKKNTLQT